MDLDIVVRSVFLRELEGVATITVDMPIAQRCPTVREQLHNLMGTFLVA
jgi:hypothetical protein